MGLSIALNNALSGMNTSQKAVDLVSRNVANAGTPGYHRQSLSVIDYAAGTSTSGVRSGAITRAFNQSLQAYQTREIADASSAKVQATFLDRLQTYLGKPGSTGSLDGDFNNFRNSLQTLATSTDDAVARADAMAKAQTLAQTLNRLTGVVQDLRTEAEAQIETNVSNLNQMLKTLEEVNYKVADRTVDGSTRAGLMDQRDRLVSQIAEVVDIRADYRTDGTVALMTRTGVGLLDVKASVLEFASAGNINATSLYSNTPGESGVGALQIRTPSGATLNLAPENVLQGGALHGLLSLRDRTLVDMQAQLDQVAAGLAQTLSTNATEGAAATSGAATGFDVDITGLESGNDLLLNYAQGGVQRAVRVVRVEDAAKLPMDFVDADGTRVLGLSFAGGAGAVATALQAALGSGLAVTSPSAGTLRVLDDGATGATDVTRLVSRTTSDLAQGGGLGLSLFMDGSATFTDSLDGDAQRIGFAGRISLNAAVVADARLLVQFASGGSLGNDARVTQLLSNLDRMRFVSSPQTHPGSRGAGLAGTIGNLINQTLNFQGNLVAGVLADAEGHDMTLESLEMRMSEEYGVNTDEEMARLLELQNAYAANARVVSIVQDLLDALMAI